MATFVAPPPRFIKLTFMAKVGTMLSAMSMICNAVKTVFTNAPTAFLFARTITAANLSNGGTQIVLPISNLTPNPPPVVTIAMLNLRLLLPISPLHVVPLILNKVTQILLPLLSQRMLTYGALGICTIRPLLHKTAFPSLARLLSLARYLSLHRLHKLALLLHKTLFLTQIL